VHHLTCGISSLLHSVNLILFTLLLVYLILRISPHHRHHIRSHHLGLSLPQSLAPDLKLISFTNPYLYGLLIFPDILHGSLTCTELSGHWRLFVLVSCARLSWSHSAFESTLNSYRIVSYRNVVIFSHQQGRKRLENAQDFFSYVSRPRSRPRLLSQDQNQDSCFRPRGASRPRPFLWTTSLVFVGQAQRS